METLACLKIVFTLSTPTSSQNNTGRRICLEKNTEQNHRTTKSGHTLTPLLSCISRSPEPPLPMSMPMESCIKFDHRAATPRGQKRHAHIKKGIHLVRISCRMKSCCIRLSNPSPTTVTNYSMTQHRGFSRKAERQQALQNLYHEPLYYIQVFTRAFLGASTNDSAEFVPSKTSI